MSRRSGKFNVPSVQANSPQRQRPSQLVAVEDMPPHGRQSYMSNHSNHRESMRSSGRQSLRRSSQLNMHAQPFVPHPHHGSSKSAQRSLGPVQEECRRVRKQIEKLALDLATAFTEENYDEVKNIGEKKKNLEDKLAKFEAQYEKDQKDISSIKQQIVRLKEQIEKAYKNEDFTKVKDLGDQKKKLQQELSDLEANFGLVNDVFYKVGDQVELTGLQTPRGSVMNGTPGVIREYMPKEKRYKIEILNDDGSTGFICISGSSRESAMTTARNKGHNLREADKMIAPGLVAVANAPGGRGSMIAVQPKNIRKRKDYQTQPGEIKLWFPKKHFGFITPDNKGEKEPDIFFHGSHVLNSKDKPIRRYARVTFRIIPAPKGPQARDVAIVSHQEGPHNPADAPPNGMPAPQAAPGLAGKEIPRTLFQPPREQNGSRAPNGEPHHSGPEPQRRPPEVRTQWPAIPESQEHKPSDRRPSNGSIEDELPSIPKEPGQMTRWASCRSTDEIDFSGRPPNLDTPVSRPEPTSPTGRGSPANKDLNLSQMVHDEMMSPTAEPKPSSLPIPEGGAKPAIKAIIEGNNVSG